MCREHDRLTQTENIISQVVQLDNFSAVVICWDGRINYIFAQDLNSNCSTNSFLFDLGVFFFLLSHLSFGFNFLPKTIRLSRQGTYLLLIFHASQWRETAGGPHKEEQKLFHACLPPHSGKRQRQTSRESFPWAACDARCDSLSASRFCLGGCVRLPQVTDMVMMRWLLSITLCHNTAQCAVFKPSGQRRCFQKHTVASHNARLCVGKWID